MGEDRLQRKGIGREIAWSWGVCALVIAAVLLVFWTAVGNGFVTVDDGEHLYLNPHLRASGAQGLIELWSKPYDYLYIPVTFTLWWGLAALSYGGGARDLLSPEFFHGANVLLHAANAALVYFLLTRLLQARVPNGRRVRGAAAVGALLFALHPLQVEAVAWASGMKDLLSGFFSLLALGCGIRWSERGTRSAYVASFVLFLLALLAKPSAASLPLSFLALDWWISGKLRSRALTHMIPWVLAAAALIVLTRAEQDFAISTALWKRPLVALDAVAFYLAKLLVPASLTIDYGRNPVSIFSTGSAYFTWLLPAGLAALAAVWRAPRVVRLAGWLFGAALLPMLGLVPFIAQGFSTVFDRYLYLAMLAPAALAAQAALGRRPRLVYSASLVLLVALAQLCHAQIRHWRDARSLLEWTLTVRPNSEMGHLYLGELELVQRNFDAAKKQLGEARAQPLSAIPDIESDLALIEFALGHPAEAEAHLRRALSLMPSHGMALNNLGALRELNGQRDEALRLYSEAVQARPLQPESHLNLGRLLVSDSTDKGTGEREIELALKLQPGLKRTRDAFCSAEGGCKNALGAPIALALPAGLPVPPESYETAALIVRN